MLYIYIANLYEKKYFFGYSLRITFMDRTQDTGRHVVIKLQPDGKQRITSWHTAISRPLRGTNCGESLTNESGGNVQLA
jgi:hypothetical protein